jgi:acetolactate synthase-1/2/3 large subunit
LAGKLETFAERARIVHIDVDPAEINKNKEAHIPMCTTTKHALTALNAALDERPLVDGLYSAWVATLATKRQEFPMTYPARDDVIIPQRAIQARVFCTPTGAELCLCKHIPSRGRTHWASDGLH